ncbi:MAG: hypothetical protein QW701_00595 [Candidatus Nezhaarchaeales archaeon]
MFVGGKATKRSRFGLSINEQITKTLETTKLISQAGLKIHVIDSEWRINDVSPSELEELLGLFPNVKTFITIATRRKDVDQLLRLYIPVIEEAGNAGLCVVAGNSIYLEGDEALQKSYKSIRRVLDQSYGRVSKIFLGIEGIEKRLSDIVSSYPEVTLFFLYDREKLDFIENYSKRGFECAIYVPYAIDKPVRDVVTAMADYVLRRSWLKKKLVELGYALPSNLKVTDLPPKLMEVLQEAVSRLSIYGTKEDVINKIREVVNHGVSIIVGLPIFEVSDQVFAFSECIKNL